MTSEKRCPVMTRLLCLAACLCLLTAAAPLTASGEAVPAAEEENAAPASYPVAEEQLTYVIGNKRMDGCMYRFNDTGDIPFVTQKSVSDLLGEIWGRNCFMDESDFPEVTYFRSDSASVSVNFETGAVVYRNFDAFFTVNNNDGARDILTSRFYDDEGHAILIGRSISGNFTRQGWDYEISLADYDIPFRIADGTGLLPLQTVSDLFFAPGFCDILYNGELAVLTSGPLNRYLDKEETQKNPLYEEYYGVGPRPVSPEMALYSYNELCLALDRYYGLKETHRIDSFDNLFISTGLQERMLDTDAAVIERALDELLFGYFGDRHSSIGMHSPWADPQADMDAVNISSTYRDSDRNRGLYSAARLKACPDGVPAYGLEEVGDTLYVSFDVFTVLWYPSAYYSLKDTDFEPFDTVSLIILADRLIRRENSPIRNVVVDLSVNGGGNLEAAVYLLGWMMGRFSIHTENTVTGGQYSMTYISDVNLDGVFNDDDNVSDLNLFCLISPNSFSCGNLVPSLLKSSGAATLLGRTSGGGACVVFPLTTALGTQLKTSGYSRISIVKNGVFYDVDKGVDPDVVLIRPESFYDRPALTEYINSLK